MMKSIAPILILGLILCMGMIPPSSAVVDSGNPWDEYGPGTSADLILLPPDTLEKIERPAISDTTSVEDEMNRSAVQNETTPEKAARLSSPAPALERPLYEPGSIIVRFKHDVADSPSLLAQVSDATHAHLGATVTMDFGDVGLSGMQMVQVPEEMSVPEALHAYSEDPDILYAEPNYYYYPDIVPQSAPAPVYAGGAGTVPDDPEFGNLWGLDNTGQTIRGRTGSADADIDAPEAWSITKGSPDVTVAVIDSGVMYTHPDLAANIWTNPGEVPGNGIDDDGNGYIDDVHGWDFYDDDNDPDDLNGHGTHCAGTIAAVGDNSIGVAGVMWDAKVMPIRFSGPDARGTTADATRAIRYATRMGADVISCSWGGTSSSRALKDAIDASPALVVCAAGNDALDNDINPHYPSSYPSENILAVAASTSTEHLASFSHFGATSVDVAAPGENILSTCPHWVAVYHDPMDSLDAWDADAPWGLNTLDYVSPPSAADDSPAGTYSPDTVAWLTTKDPIDTRGLQGTTLLFNVKWDLEENYDNLTIVASSDNRDYYMMGYLTGSSGGDWYTYSVPLDMYDGGQVYLGFILFSDGSVEKGGVLIDDVWVVGAEPFSGAYEYYSGTSMAAPHVSGVAGLLRSVNASLSATEMKDAIIDTVDTNPAYTGKMVSGGRVNADRAVSAVLPVIREPPSIEPNKETVVRGNDFVMVITGEPSSPYWVYVEEAPIRAEEYPFIPPFQTGVTAAGTLFSPEAAAVPETAKAVVTTRAAGTRVVEFRTNTSTGVMNYTVRVVDPSDPALGAGATIQVEQGEVTIAATGTGVYDVGEEIVLSGTNTDSMTTYLFVTKAGLEIGTKLDDMTVPCVTGDAGTFTGVDVLAGDTWEYRWDTGACGRVPDTGTYTVYAVAVPHARNDLAGAAYGSASVALNRGATTRIAVVPASSTLTVGKTREYPVVLDTVPDGLSEFDLTVALTDPSVAEIVSVSCPAWALAPVKGSLPSDRVSVRAADLNGVIGAGATDVTLCTLTVRGDGVGETNLTVTAAKVDDDSGGRYVPETTDALLGVEEPPILEVNFTATPTSGPAPLTVQFTDMSVKSPMPLLWTFGDGATSTAQHPTHTYVTPGNYSVTFSVGGGEGSCTRPSYITVTRPLYGDANDNGVVNQADTLRVLKEVVGLSPKPEEGTSVFVKTDVDRNGVIEVGDAMFIAQYNVGLRDGWFELIG